MSLISLVGAAKDFGIRTLFSDLDLHIGEGERLGLIGPNGAGKSTLLKVLAGKEPLGEGERRCSPRLRVELVGQESRITPGLTVLEQVLEGCGAKRDLLVRFSALSDAIAEDPSNEALMAELGQLSQRMDEEDAWSLEQQCREVLQKLGISDLQRPVDDLSGGYRKRVGLASALVACPDVLLLDEPTNHLDAAAVEWLQSWLDRYPGALVLVTHDRYVLDRVTRRLTYLAIGGLQPPRLRSSADPGDTRHERKRGMFKGSMPALVTPFKDGAVDFDTLKKLVDWQRMLAAPGLA